MTKAKLLSIDLTKKEEYLKFHRNQSFIKVYETGLCGQGIVHVNHPACEYNETYQQQHCIVVHLRPEQNSLRRIGDRQEVENIGLGDVTIIPANVSHWRRLESGTCEALLLNITPQKLANIAHEKLDPDRVELLNIFTKPEPLIQHLSLNIKACLDSDNYDKIYIESLFHSLLMHLLFKYTSRKVNLKEFKDGLPSIKLKQATEYINDNLDKSIRLNDVADILEISQFYFCRLFRKSTGLSPYKYVIRQRIKKSQELIRDGNLSLADIAYECGFSSQSQMTQHFRKVVGVTPKVYQDSL